MWSSSNSFKEGARCCVEAEVVVEALMEARERSKYQRLEAGRCRAEGDVECRRDTEELQTMSDGDFIVKSI